VPHGYPLMLDVSQRLVVVIGGGAVAVRKAKGLLEAGATRVRVVAPGFHPEMPPQVERVVATYETKHLDGAQLVFAATDSPAVNEQVARDAAARGAWINRSDDGERGDFATPARLRQGEVIVTVSTAGNAALAAAIRDDLAAKLDPRHVKLADAMKTLRPAVRNSVADPQRRAAILRDLASEGALHAVAVDNLREWIQSRYPDLKF